MSRRSMHLNPFAAHEEMRAERAQAPILCPKPRRLSLLSGAADFDRVRFLPGPFPESFDSNDGVELLDIFLLKGGGQNLAASSPPFFSGSPPTRSANPLIHDARFGEDKPGFFAHCPVHAQPGGSPMSPRKGCGPTKFGLKPAAVRIEGFDCLDRRDCPTRGITAVA